MIAQSNPLGANPASRPTGCAAFGIEPVGMGRDVKSGAAHYREALALAQLHGMRPLVAHCHLGLGELYRRTGKSDCARENLTTATTMYREMDMGFWLEQSKADRTNCGDVESVFGPPSKSSAPGRTGGP